MMKLLFSVIVPPPPHTHTHTIFVQLGNDMNDDNNTDNSNGHFYNAQIKTHWPLGYVCSHLAHMCYILIIIKMDQKSINNKN